ncbi:MAG: hypothetical protein E7244_27890 [Enterocloster citroniae]|nr:hypothetical protein [Enterocloster citroniae]
MAGKYYLIYDNKDEQQLDVKKTEINIKGSSLKILEAKYLSSQDILTINDHYNKTNKLHKKAIKHRIYNTVSKIAFPLSCSGYIIMMSSGFLNENIQLQYFISLFMVLFSLGTSIIFSDCFNKKYIEAISSIEIRTKIKLDEATKKLLKLVLVVLFAALLWFIMMLKPNNLNIPLVTKDNIGNILTWFSIIIFAVDKTN